MGLRLKDIEEVFIELAKAAGPEKNSYTYTEIGNMKFKTDGMKEGRMGTKISGTLIIHGISFNLYPYWNNLFKSYQLSVWFEEANHNLPNDLSPSSYIKWKNEVFGEEIEKVISKFLAEEYEDVLKQAKIIGLNKKKNADQQYASLASKLRETN